MEIERIDGEQIQTEDVVEIVHFKGYVDLKEEL